MIALVGLVVLKLCRLSTLAATCYLVHDERPWWAGVCLALFVFGVGERRPPAAPAVKP